MITITRTADQPEQATMQVKNAVYVTADRSKAVPAGHPDAAFLLAGPNGNVSQQDAKRYSLTEDGAEGQEKPKSIVVEPFKHGVTPSTPDGVNTAPDSPQARAPKPSILDEDDDEKPQAKTEKPSATGLAPAKKRG